MRHPYTIITLIAFIAIVYLGVFVHQIAPKRALNARFGRLAGLSALMVLLDFGLRSATTQAIADFWWRCNFFWPFIVLSALDLTSGLEARAPRSWAWWVLGFGGAVTLSLVELSTDWVTHAPIPLEVGWYYGPARAHWIGPLNQLWVNGTLAAALVGGTRRMSRSARYTRSEVLAFVASFLIIITFVSWHEITIHYSEWFGRAARFPALPVGLALSLGLVTLGLFLGQQRRARAARVAEEAEVAERLERVIEERSAALVESTQARQALQLRAQSLRLDLEQGRKEQPLGRATSGVAHDLKNVYSGVDGAAQLMLLEAGPRELEALAQIRRAVEEGQAEIEALLSLTRARALEPHPFDLGALTIKLAPTLERLLDVEVEVTRAEAPLTVHAEEEDVTRALLLVALIIEDRARPTGPVRIGARREEGAGHLTLEATLEEPTNLTAERSETTCTDLQSTLELLEEHLGAMKGCLDLEVDASHARLTLRLPLAAA